MSEGHLPMRLWYLPRSWHDTAAWIITTDILAVIVVIVMPWSTSLLAIAIVLWILSLIPTLDISRFLQSVKRPESAIPVALFVLAAIGTLWATDIAWATRLRGINPAAKLLVIPLLIYHFERSTRTVWVFAGFLASCTALLILSLILFSTKTYLSSDALGVPVKDYIAQSQEFALCAFGAAGASILFLREGRSVIAYNLMALSVAFIANMAFVATSRTVLICIPVLAIVFSLKYFGKRGVLIAMVAATLAGAVVWNTSPLVRGRVLNVTEEYQKYKSDNASTSTGMRLEYWRKSIKFITQDPLLGHGTGSIKTLFERDAVGQTGVSSEIIGNPHNQTLNVMVQWGVVGGIILYAMWITHFLVFQVAGLAAWIGLVAVVENFTSSLFNSHIFDFIQGWIYVVAVGVAAGTVYKEKISQAARSDISP